MLRRNRKYRMFECDEKDSLIELEFNEYMYGDRDIDYDNSKFNYKRKMYENIQSIIKLCEESVFQKNLPIIPIHIQENTYPYHDMANYFPYTYNCIIIKLCNMDDFYVFPIIEVLAKHATTIDPSLLKLIMKQALISGSSLLFDIATEHVVHFNISTYHPSYAWEYLFCRKNYMDDSMIKHIQINRINIAKKYMCGYELYAKNMGLWFRSVCKLKLYILAQFIIDTSQKYSFSISDLQELFLYACHTGDNELLRLYSRSYPCKYLIMQSDDKPNIIIDSNDNIITPICNTSLCGVILSDKNEKWQQMRSFYIYSYKSYNHHYIPIDIVHHISTFI
jgi:hypothetical protein